MKSLFVFLALLFGLQSSAQFVDEQPTESVAPLVLQILKFPDGSTMMTHSGEIVASDLCGLDVVDSIHLAEKYVPYLKNEKSAMVFWVAKGAEPFLTLSDILKVYNIKKYETDIVKLNNLRLQESELEPLFSKNNIHSVQKTGNVISIITKHHLMREEAKKQGKPHCEIDKIAPRNEFWPTENDMNHREELKKR